MFIGSISVGAVLLFYYQFFVPQERLDTKISNGTFGWKIPAEDFRKAGQVTDSDAWSSIRNPGGAPSGLPVRLKIPSIGVDSAVEDAYITPDGRMDVPEGSVNVAWYALGPKPGQPGSAVIGGHFGIDDGVPKVFYRLNELQAGDKIYIVDDRNNTLAFMVKSIRLFGRDDDSTPVFISRDGNPHLNVITCEGEWNMVDDSYPDRRVVFADSIPSEEVPMTVVKPVRVAPTLTAIKASPAPSIVTVTDVPVTEAPIVIVATPSADIEISKPKSLWASFLDFIYSFTNR